MKKALAFITTLAAPAASAMTLQEARTICMRVATPNYYAGVEECAKHLVETDTANTEAPSTNVQQHEDAMDRIADDFVLARIAMYCGLRSEGYFSVFVRGSMAVQDDANAKYPLTETEKTIVDRHFAERDRNLVAAWPCRKLLNSPEMDALDADARRLTGGYQ